MERNELREYARVIWRWLWLIALGTLVAGGVAFIVSRQQVPLYQTTTTLFLNPSPVLPYRVTQPMESLANTYTEFMRTRSFAQLVAQEMGDETTFDEVLGAISTRYVNGTQFFKVSTTHANPEKAQKLANTTARVLIHNESFLAASEEAVSVDAAVVVDEAWLPTKPLERKVLQNTLLAAMVGCMLAVGVAFLVEYLDDFR